MKTKLTKIGPKSAKTCALKSKLQISKICALICLWQINAFGQILYRDSGAIAWDAVNSANGYNLFLTSQNKSSNEVFTSYLYSNKLVGIANTTNLARLWPLSNGNYRVWVNSYLGTNISSFAYLDFTLTNYPIVNPPGTNAYPVAYNKRSLFIWDASSNAAGYNFYITSVQVVESEVVSRALVSTQLVGAVNITNLIKASLNNNDYVAWLNAYNGSSTSTFVSLRFTLSNYVVSVPEIKSIRRGD